MANTVSNLWGAAKSGLGSIGHALGSVASGIGGGLGGIAKGAGDFLGQFGLSGPTGQAASGGAGATLPALSQSITNLPSFSGGGGASLSPSSFGGGGSIADAGGGSWLDGVLGKLPNLTQQIEGVGAGLSTPTFAGGGSPQSGGISGLLSGLLGKGGSNILPIGMLINSAIHANDEPAGLSDLRGVASNMRDQGGLLTRSATAAMEGHLPGPAQSAIDQALRAAQAGVRSNYAGLGLTGSSMETQDLNAAAERAIASRFQIGQQMAQTGLNAASNNNNYSASLYKQIMDALTARDTAFGTALSRFAGLTAH